MKTPVTRFTGTVENYVKYRPGFPKGLVQLLESECGLKPSSAVADLGSGTGMLSELFLDNGNAVFAVEPNEEMRRSAEQMLGDRSGFRSIAGTAENTTLARESVDIVAVGRALQWFDLPSAIREMSRILRPCGYLAAVWNRPKRPLSAQFSQYRSLLRKYCRELEAKNSRRAAAMSYLVERGFKIRLVEFVHHLDLEQLGGLVRSLSIAPDQTDPNFEPLFREIEELFVRHQIDGYVKFDYATTVYYGKLAT